MVSRDFHVAMVTNHPAEQVEGLPDKAEIRFWEGVVVVMISSPGWLLV